MIPNWNPLSGGSDYRVYFHHGKTANFCYGDGHAEALTEGEFVTRSKEHVVSSVTAVSVWDESKKAGVTKSF